MRRLLLLAKWLGAAAIVLIALLLLPIGYIETFCRQEAEREPTSYAPIIIEGAFQRVEANTYLTYPEWHIVYVYEGLARTLETDDDYAFGYAASVRSFWSSFCDLNRTAGKYGGADFATRSMIHTIGVSFTLEMAMKALYEETLGRLFAVLRGAEKTPQDIYSAEMAAGYTEFLLQEPWYKYDFQNAIDELWKRPLTSPLRSWERRLALSGEWKTKSAYAKIIAYAVAATEPAPRRIRSVVRGMTPSELSGIPEVDIVEITPQHAIIETPRYRKFTNIVQKIASMDGQIIEIAGNDDIMVSIKEPPEAKSLALGNGTVISRMDRDGYGDNRILVALKVRNLTALLRELPANSRILEHIYDY